MWKILVTWSITKTSSTKRFGWQLVQHERFPFVITATKVWDEKKVSKTSCEVIAIGASTGGTEAIRDVLSAFPAGMPPIIISQHISAMFSKSFANRLNECSAIDVKELSTSCAPLVCGSAYVAPGDKHITVIRKGSHLYCQLDDRPLVNRHKLQ